MLKSSELTDRLLKSSVLPSGIRIALNAIELYYARYSLLFPAEKFRDDDAFREYFSKVSDHLANGLLESLRGVAFRVELYASERPFTVYLVMECLPDSSITASSNAPTFKFFKVSGGKSFRLGDGSFLHLTDGEPIGWFIRNEDTLVLKIPTEGRILNLTLDASVSSWLSSQDSLFRGVNS